MINDRQMNYVRSDGEYDLYIFTPTLIRQYYNKNEEWTPHRKKITHKLHMMLYYIRSGYNILYIMNGDVVAAYVIYARCGKTVIKGTSREDIYTVLLRLIRIIEKED